MPKVDGKKFPYTKAGEAEAKMEAKRTGTKMEVKTSVKKKKPRAY